MEREPIIEKHRPKPSPRPSAAKSDDVYELLKRSGITFPSDCVEIVLTLKLNEPAELTTTQLMKRDGMFVIKDDEVLREGRRYMVVDKDKPVICSCCGRYVRHTPAD